MERFKRHGAIDPQTGAAIHDADEALRRRLVPCNKRSGCDNTPPELSKYDQYVLDFFIQCHNANLWVRGEFAGERRHLERTAVEIEARARRVVLSEYFLDKLQICEAAVREYDFKRRAAETPR